MESTHPRLGRATPRWRALERPPRGECPYIPSSLPSSGHLSFLVRLNDGLVEGAAWESCLCRGPELGPVLELRDVEADCVVVDRDSFVVRDGRVSEEVAIGTIEHTDDRLGRRPGRGVDDIDRRGAAGQAGAIGSDDRLDGVAQQTLEGDYDGSTRKCSTGDRHIAGAYVGERC